MSAETRLSPYQGLVPYSESDAGWFFGRDALTEVVIDNLMAYRLSLLYGPSGAGKSSLLNAGVAYRLRSRADPIAYGFGPTPVVVLDRWLEDPVEALGEQVSAVLGAGRGRGTFVDVLRAWGRVSEVPVLIVLDQFEEYFVYHVRSGGDDPFATQLAHALVAPDVPANFLLSLREDAVPQLDVLDGVVPDLFDNLIRVRHLDRESAETAILGPIARWNTMRPEHEEIAVEAELTAKVLDEVQAGRVRVELVGRGELAPDEEASRPIEAAYLQLVMNRLFEHENGAGSRILRAATLDFLGGAEQIVREHLDETIAELPRRARRVAERVFEYLVTPAGTKIALPASALATWTKQDPREVGAVLGRLAAGDRRILRSVPTPDQPDPSSFELFHDRLAPGVLAYRSRSQQRRRRRRLRILGGATVVLVVALAAVGLVLRQTEADLEAVTVLDARLTSVTLRTPRVLLGTYLTETGQPKTGLTFPELAQSGLVFDVGVRLRGFQGQRCPLRWTVFDARTNQPLRPVAQFSQTATTLIAASPDQVSSVPVWVPHPITPKRVFVRFRMGQEGGGWLAELTSETLVAGP